MIHRQGPEVVKIDSKDNLIRLVNSYRNLVFSVCLKMTGDYFTAEDITQETFILAYQHYKDFDGNNEKAWICRIASNKCIDYLRMAERRSIPTPEEEMPEKGSNANNPMILYENREIIEKLTEACNKLPETYRDVALRHFLKGQTAAEIAKKTGENQKTVQTRIRRSKEMLKEYIRKEDLQSE